jgi:hypothetical protein
VVTASSFVFVVKEVIPSGRARQCCRSRAIDIVHINFQRVLSTPSGVGARHESERRLFERETLQRLAPVAASERFLALFAVVAFTTLPK